MPQPDDAMTRIESLRQMLAEKSVKRGNFRLASGKLSSVYVDARLTTMSPEGMRLIGLLGLEHIRKKGWEADAIGGLTLGADPVAYAISLTSADDARPLRAFTVRKEPKTHGTARLIEGPFKPGDNVVIIEDVVTTGGSAIRAIDAVVSEGGLVLGVLAVVDRCEGGSEAIADHGYDTIALTSIDDLVPLVS
jgi:orotate phosphoribosyltransferase